MLSKDNTKLESHLHQALAAGGLIMLRRFFTPDRVDISGGIKTLPRLQTGELEGGWKGWLGFVHPEDLARVSEQMNKSLSQGETYTLEYRLGGEDHPVWVRDQGVVHYGSDQVPSIIYSIVREISEIQELESRLGHAQKMESFGKLAGGVAHDFNNILAVILGYAHLVLDDFAKEDPRLHFIQEIESAARRASSLTSQLLAFTRQEVQGTLVLQMDGVLNEMGNMLERLLGERIKLILNPKSGEVGKVLADRNQIEQLLIHLCICARDLLPGGGFLTLHTRVVEAEGEGAQERTSWRFLLAAECCSFSPTDQTKTTPGAAIPWSNELAALDTCDSIAKASRGSLRPGGYPQLPDALAVFFPLVTPPSPSPNLRGAIPNGAAASGDRVDSVTVLLVEDDKGLRNLGRVVLTRMGYRVIEAGNGLEGLRAFDLAPPSSIALIITDVVMPAMGGREMVEQIAERYPSLPVLFLSGYPEQFQKILQGPQPQTHSFLSKPFPMGDLTKKVRELLEQEG